MKEENKWKVKHRQTEHLMSATIKSVITTVENETIMGKWGTYLTMF